MSMPTLKVEAGFGFEPHDTVATWTDLTSRVGFPAGIKWEYGRSSEREQADAGVGTIAFDNSDRALDPTNTASPFFPDVKPMVPVRVTATHNSADYPVLYAHVEAWPPRWAGSEYGWVTVQLVDGFKLLSMSRTSIERPEQKTGARIHELLDAAGWPAGRRQIDDGQSFIQAYDASQRIVLNAIRETADVEQGRFFIDPSGDAVFLDRLRWNNPTSQATFGETGSDLPYETIEVSFDESEVWNDIAVNPLELGVQRAVDQASIDAYGHRWLERLDVRVISENVANDLAHAMLSRYREPQLRVERLTLEGDLFSTTPDVLTQILSRRVGDAITVKSQPAGGGAELSVDAMIERVVHRVETESWRTTYQLSPSFAESYWLLGISGSSELGQTTVLGF